MSQNKLKITQIKSKNGRLSKHKSTLLGLGIKKINQNVIVNSSPEILGMINKIYYMIKVEVI